MSIYTKSGDKGTTSLYSGRRISKTDPLIAASGTVDELNSILGFVVSKIRDKETRGKLSAVQRQLITAGSDLANPENIDAKHRSVRITSGDTAGLEVQIDLWEKELTQLNNFIIPGGTEVSALLHQARAVCRRAERDTVKAGETWKLNPELFRFLNRLSDWLFMAARYEGRPQVQP